MLDRDLAKLYNVIAIRLREKVKRNSKRFPEDFMFQLTKEESHFLVSQNAIPSNAPRFPRSKKVCRFTQNIFKKGLIY